MMMKATIETELHLMGNLFQRQDDKIFKNFLRWDKSNNDFPVELAEVDLLKHENKEESSSISPDGEKTVPVVIRWHEPAKSGDLKMTLREIGSSVFGEYDVIIQYLSFAVMMNGKLNII